jgi:hypothetical protein
VRSVCSTPAHSTHSSQSRVSLNSWLSLPPVSSSGLEEGRRNAFLNRGPSVQSLPIPRRPDWCPPTIRSVEGRVSTHSKGFQHARSTPLCPVDRILRTITGLFSDLRRVNPRATRRRPAEFQSKLLHKTPCRRCRHEPAPMVCLVFVILGHIVHGTSRFIQSSRACRICFVLIQKHMFLNS